MCGYPMFGDMHVGVIQNIWFSSLLDQGVVATLSDFWAHLPRFWLLLMFTSSSS